MTNSGTGIGVASGLLTLHQSKSTIQSLVLKELHHE